MDHHDEKKRESGGEKNGAEKKVADVEALKKCLKENKGDVAKCKSLVEAFKSSSSSSRVRPMRPMRLRSGSWTDV